MTLSVPFLWITEYNTNPNQCYINVSKNVLKYVFSFNVLLVILPTVGLTILYLMIIVKLKRRNHLLSRILNSNHMDVTPENSKFIIKKMTLSGKRDLEYDQIFELKPLSSRPSSSSSQSQNCERIKFAPKTKSSITISIVSVIFYSFQLPARLILSWFYLKDTIDTNENIQLLNGFDLFEFLLHAVILIYYLHCVSNPIIYNLLPGKFRKSLLKFIKK